MTHIQPGGYYTLPGLEEVEEVIDLRMSCIPGVPMYKRVIRNVEYSHTQNGENDGHFTHVHD